jgi:tetratricopeptide (TPR) repeat protein
MQPLRNPDGATGADPSPSALLTAARAAWFAGEFSHCLDLLETLAPLRPTSPLYAEAVLLRARSLYRLRRYDQAVALLTPLAETFGENDEACTAKMLLGTALARAGRVDEGLAALDSVAEIASGLGAHPAVRAEIAHGQALAHWLRAEQLPDAADREAEYHLALRHAVSAEQGHADVISVRATQLRGFVALRLHRYREALALFQAALDAYRLCRERDTDLADATVLQITALEVALRSRGVPGTHAIPNSRRTRRVGEPVAASASIASMMTLALDGWGYAHDGDARNALRLAREADALAQTAAWRVWALANRAGIALAFGESLSASDLAAHAVELAHGVDWDQTRGEERVGLLLLAETLAVTSPSEVREIADRYASLSSKLLPDQVFYADPRLIILERTVAGHTRRIAGDVAGAVAEFKAAHALAMQYGIAWRAADALIQLHATFRDDVPRADFYLEAASRIVREHLPNSFLARRIGSWLRAYDDPIVSKLRPSHREVLSIILETGWPVERIAASRGVAPTTIKKHIAALREAFGVHSIAELIVECHRRGLGAALPANGKDHASRYAVPGV